jgi:hypothetical protein
MAAAQGAALALLNAGLPAEDTLAWHVSRSGRSALRTSLGLYHLIVPRSDVVGRARVQKRASQACGTRT